MIDSTSPRRIVSCLLVVAVLASGSLVGVAATEYAVSTDSEADTPTRTVEIDGSEYTISTVATAQVDASLTVSIQVPEGESYVLDVYNDDEQAVVETHSGYGSQAESIDLSGVEAGTYAIALQVDGDLVDVEPLVVEGVSVSLSVPSEVGSTEGLTATVETSPIDGETAPQAVEVAVWNDDETIRVDATETESGTYQATVDGLAAGDYRVYAAARGSGTVMGEPNVVGASDGSRVTVSADESGGDPGGGNSGGGDEEETANSSDRGSTDDGDRTGGDQTSNDGGDGSNDNDSETGTDPQSPTEPENSSDDASDSVPVVGPPVLIVPLALLLGEAVRRRREA